MQVGSRLKERKVQKSYLLTAFGHLKPFCIYFLLFFYFRCGVNRLNHQDELHASPEPYK